jgi:hypothetical protein
VWKASVYPVVLTVKKGAKRLQRGSRKTEIYVAESNVLDHLDLVASIPESDLKAIPDHLWSFVTQPGVNVLTKVLASSSPLEKLAGIEVCGASTVTEGSQYPTLLSGDGEANDNEARFIVSGSVQRYATTWQTEAVSFTHKKYIRPTIRLRTPMPQRRISQARTPKIIICKVALRPRAFVDRGGEYVGAYTTYVLAQESELDFLVAVIN